MIDWLIKTTADLEAFDAKVQSKVQQYSNKQARKAFIAGMIASVIAMAVLGWAF